jgi:hypothetical protein
MDVARFSHLWATPLVDNSGSEVPPLHIAEEQTLLRSVLESSAQVIVYESVVANAGTFMHAMQASNSVVHFTGHGTEREGLCLEYAGDHHNQAVLGMTHMFGLEEVYKLVADDATSPSHGLPQLVFVSACHSENVGKAFCKLGVPHVVAVHTCTEVMDDASKKFAEMFYLQLLSAPGNAGKSVVQAFNMAKRLVRAEFDCGSVGSSAGSSAVGDIVEHEKFLLLGHGNHELPIDFSCDCVALPAALAPVTTRPPAPPKAHELATTATPAVPFPVFFDNSPLAPRGVVQAPTPLLVGRAEEIRTVYRSLHHPSVRVCCVVGPPGVGKTTVALRAIQYGADRREFQATMQLSLCHDEHDERAGGVACSRNRRELVLRLWAAQSATFDEGFTMGMGRTPDGGGEDKTDALLERFIERERTQRGRGRGGGGDVVLFLDHCDDWIASASSSSSSFSSPPSGTARELVEVVDRLVRCCGNHFRVVLGGAVEPPFMVQVEHVIAEVAPADKRLMALLFMKWCKRPLSRAEVKGECPDAEAECLDHVTLFSQHPLVEALAGYPGAAVHTAALVTQGAGEHERSQDREHGPSPSFELVRREAELCSFAEGAVRGYRARHRKLQGAVEAQVVNTLRGARTAPLPPASLIPKVERGGTGESPPLSLAAITGSSRRSGAEDSEFQTLRCFPWWHGDLATRDQSKARLAAEKSKVFFSAGAAEGSSVVDGIFLVRPSGKGLGFFACDLFVQGGRYLPMLIERVFNEAKGVYRYRLQECKTPGIALGGAKAYSSIEQLVARNGQYLRTPCSRPLLEKS